MHFPFTLADWIIICISGVGAIGGEVANWIEYENLPSSRRPETVKNRFFWLRVIATFLLAVILGGVYQMSNFNLAPIVALNVGATAPLVFKSLMNKVPPEISKGIS